MSTTATALSLAERVDAHPWDDLNDRPRAQSRAHVVNPPRGAFVIFPTNHRPQQGKRGYYKVGLRHGVSTITRGRRTALGIIFHDAR
jgi:hypothetical protein